MLNNIYLLKFNNYYNRTIKKYDNISYYLPFLCDSNAPDENGNYPILENVNFIPNDGVNTTQTVNWGGAHADYVVVTDLSGNNILSRWFVIEEQRQRAGQYTLMLHRDVIVDFFDSVVYADTFIEKATLPGSNNLIFNKENITFNQIKRSEILIKDQSNCPWICIYAASKKADGSDTQFSTKTVFNLNISRSMTQAEFESWDVYKASAAQSQIWGNLRVEGIYAAVYKALLDPYYAIDKVNGYLYSSQGYESYTNRYDIKVSDYQNNPLGIQLASPKKNFSEEEFQDMIDPYYPQIEEVLGIQQGINLPLYNEIGDLNNQSIEVRQSDGSRKYYQVNTTYVDGGIESQLPVMSSQNKLYTDVLREFNKEFCHNNVSTQKYIYLFYRRYGVQVTLVDITSSVKVSGIDIGVSRYHLNDAPYDMFVMPYSDSLKIVNSAVVGFKEVIASKQLALNIARALIEQYAGTNQIYDAQILPYCPLVDSEVIGNEIDLNCDAKGYAPILEETNTVGYVLHATLSSFTRKINLDKPIIIKDYKMENETDLYRLCSPNYNGVFEFSAAMNGGVAYFNVACTYKPYNPYIKLYPNWGRLYGTSNQNDARGLICGGDFSLPMTTSAWATYELQNKNYQNSFDRQIQNLETNNRIQRKQEIAGIVGGALGAGANAASTGAMLGGPLGALAGGVFGGVSSAIAGAVDLGLSDQLRNEALDYTRDQFGYSLGNIQALPQSLAKVSAFNVDNKYFPFLEYYTCSDEEKEALRRKLKYNGMTVMVIDKIQNYRQQEPTYIKGKLIRMLDEIGNYSIVKAIAAELDKGVFI